MEAIDIKSLNDCQNYLEGCINDFEGGVSTKEETLEALREYTARITDLAFTAAGKWKSPEQELPGIYVWVLVGVWNRETRERDFYVARRTPENYWEICESCRGVYT